MQCTFGSVKKNEEKQTYSQYNIAHTFLGCVEPVNAQNNMYYEQTENRRRRNPILFDSILMGCFLAARYAITQRLYNANN